MVILPEWQRAAAADLGRSGAEVMPGEDAGSGARASPPVGYLGKVQERAASLDCCPWCASKGLRSSLRLCRLNLHESVTLCTEPQCLFPLVSRPLEDVLASLAPAETTTAGGRKRKASSRTENKGDCQEVKVKCLRSGQLHTRAPSPLPSGHHETAVTHVEPSDGVSRPPQDRLSHKRAAGNGEENSGFSVTPWTDEDDGPAERLAGAPRKAVDASGRFTSAAEGPVAASREPVASPEEPVDTSLGTVPEQTAETPNESVIQEPFGVPAAPLFWNNARNLCWLDVLLVVLVNCESLRRRKARHEPRPAAVWRLMSGYDRARDALQAGSGEQARVRRDADERLQSLRMAVLELLRPQLGQKESPVFAMPLLLAADSWAEPLFRTTFCWEFECAECKTVTRERVTKTLPTFTNVVPDWHPMRATHWAVCNACGAQRQRRSMKLERVAAVLALHFAEGVPHGDLDALAFTLEGRRHAVTALVQYDRRAEHFVAWTRTPGGSWLEFDDLKHPQSPLHPTLPVPAQEMHLVFWEAQEASLGSGACSPSSTRPDSPPSLCVVPDRHFLARDEEEEEESVATADACGDVSISSVTLLDAFHGLSHDDIVTLTLTEVAADAPTDYTALLDDIPAPDSSSLTPEDPGETPPQSAESNADNDPDYDPASEEAPTRRKRISKVKHQRAGKTAKMTASPQGGAAQASGPPPHGVRRASPVSSTGGPPSPHGDHTSRWSFLLSHHLANQRPNGATPTPAQRPSSHSAPARKPQLLPMEDGDGHPLKAAETFGAFGAAVQRPPAFSKNGSCHQSRSQIQAGSPAPGPPAVLSDTEALRYKLLKKLKAKKRKLAKLDRLLARRPDSAAPISADGFLPRDLLLPSPSAAVSPDSSGFLDALACRQDATPDAPQPPLHTENFLDEFFSMTPVAAQQTMEDETLRELELLLS